jgi:hypothetical protein
METSALLRRLKRLGVLQVDWAQAAGDGGVVLRARVQTGRAHAALETTPQRDTLSALEELAALAADATRDQRTGRRRKPTAKPLSRPGAGEATGEVDDVPLALQPERLAQLPPNVHRAREAARAAAKAARPERVTARHRPSRRRELEPGRTPDDRPGRGGGR